MTLKVIAYARNGHTDKFGIPRQSREESPILTRIVFEPEFCIPEALRGIEGYSHLWLLWGFSRSFSSHASSSIAWQEVLGDARSPQKIEILGDPNTFDWSPTVRPPRLGGNKRMGVFATRSPFRPNPIGLSSVKLVGIVEKGKFIQTGIPESRNPGIQIGKGMELIVSGADIMDGTPIYDIKPYLSFSDSHPDARNGFAEETKNLRLPVNYSALTLAEFPNNNPLITHKSPTNHPLLPCNLVEELTYILSQDPRPGYQDDPEREYKLDYAGYRVTFCVQPKQNNQPVKEPKFVVVVKKIEQID